MTLLGELLNWVSQSPLKASWTQAFSSFSFIQFSLLLELDQVPTVSQATLPSSCWVFHTCLPNILQEQTRWIQDDINHWEGHNSVQRADKALFNLEQKVCMLTSSLMWDLWDTGTTSPYKYLLLDPDSVVITAKYWPAAAAPPSIIHCEERFVLFNLRNWITLKYWTSFYHNFKPTLKAWIWMLYAFWQAFHLSSSIIV